LTRLLTDKKFGYIYHHAPKLLYSGTSHPCTSLTFSSY